MANVFVLGDVLRILPDVPLDRIWPCTQKQTGASRAFTKIATFYMYM